MSQLCYHEIPLDMLVARSQLIAVVHPADPAHTITEVPVVAPPLEPGEPPPPNPDEPLPPYPKRTNHLVIDEVLFDETGQGWGPGGNVDADQANWQRQLKLHTQYHAKGLSVSPIYMRYQGCLAEGEASYIAFLSSSQGGFGFAVAGARESLEKRTEVEAAIAARPPSVRVIEHKRSGFWARLFGRKG